MSPLRCTQPANPFGGCSWRFNGTRLEGYEEGDTNHGYIIRAEARKISESFSYRKNRSAMRLSVDSD